MAITRTTATQNLGLDAQYDRGTGMKLKVYSGTPPANANASLSGNTLLATLTLSNTPFAPAASGVKTANAITSANAVASGMASFNRLTKSDDTVVSQGTVSAAGGGGDAIINSTSVVSGTTVACSALSFTSGG